MITITILGLDQYIVGRLSAELTPNIAKLYEVDEDAVNFVAPNNMVFHKGVEQTSWNVLVKVNAPMKVQVLQDEVANLLSIGLRDVTINLAIEFYYYSQDNRYERINKDYPRYISESNLVNTDQEFYGEDECDDDDCCCGHHHDHEGSEDDCACVEEEEEIYEGDIFADFGIEDK